MTTVNSLSGAGGTRAFEPAGESINSMSPSDIVAYVSMMLNDIDGQLLDYKHTAEAKLKTSTEIRELLSLVRDMNGKNGFNAGALSEEDKAKLFARFDSMIANTSDAEIRQAIQSLATQAGFKLELELNVGGPTNQNIGATIEGPISKDTLDDLITKWGDSLNSLNSENELTMMQLGSLMQRRSQIVQFSSNALQTLYSAMDAPIQNLRG